MTKLTQHYQTDPQVKYLHLEAEVEILLQQLQTIKQQQLRAKLTKIENQ